MPTTIEKLSGEAIVIIRVDTQDFSPESAQAFEGDLAKLLDSQSEPVFLINVLPADYSFDMDDLMEATALVTAQSYLYHHANIKGMAAVTRSDTLKMAYDGLAAEAFGGLQVRTFATLEEAIAHARS